MTRIRGEGVGVVGDPVWQADQLTQLTQLTQARKDHAFALSAFCGYVGWSQRQAEALLELIEAQRVLNHAEVAMRMIEREGADGGGHV